MSQPESAPPSRGAVAAADHDLSDAEFAELDAILAEIPAPLEPLDVVMLDGFLCGVIVQPTLLDADAWLPYVFDAGGHRWGEAEPAPEQLRARALILRRHAALNRSIAEFGSFDPFILEPTTRTPPPMGDERRSDAGRRSPADDTATRAAGRPDRRRLLPWVAGFEQAVHLLPGLADLDDAAGRDDAGAPVPLPARRRAGHRRAGRARAAARHRSTTRSARSSPASPSCTS